MARILYKQKCAKCKKNYVLVMKRDRYQACYECQKKELEGEITDKKMKKFFDIPHQFYVDNSFLRNIKINYLRYKNLTDKQMAAFEKSVKEMEELEKNKPAEPDFTPDTSLI